ncbi:hypothetical protein BDN67DRAFT_914442 [Paxillus ammoniavirescens]|nr:hypothetical protein BDN67DRAFT_914442 [Paxillus ammoniavirescens]
MSLPCPVCPRERTHLDPALIGTASLTRSAKGLLAALASFFPPIEANTAVPVANSVPRVRYSLMSTRRFMSKLSNVHRGTAFEQRSLQVLQDTLSMSLRRVGGKSDGGIDLVGWWWLPFSNPPLGLDDGLPRRRLRVLAQCKAEKKKFGPNYVREMEGVWHTQSRSLSPSHSLSPSYERERLGVYSTVALLLSESPFSQSTLLRAYKSTVPFLLVHLPPTIIYSSPLTSTSESSPTSPNPAAIGAVFPNPTLTNLVNPLVICWERSSNAIGENMSIGARPGLWWHGHKLRSWTPDFGVVLDTEDTGMA